MFVLSTAEVFVLLVQSAGYYGPFSLPLTRLDTAIAVIYVTNNILADGLLIYRCYVIWGTNYILIVPVLLLLVTIVFGYSLQLRLFFILSLTTNLFVSTLTAGRIWWITRLASPLLESQTLKRSSKAVAIVLESGAIYAIAVSIHMVLFHLNLPGDDVAFLALGQIVGIVPTLIIVRVGLGATMECNMASSESGSNPQKTQISTLDISCEGEKSAGWNNTSPV